MAEKILVVVLDAGHGGSDPGAVGSTGVQEKVVTLAITRLVAAHLGSAGCDVVLARASDVDIPLETRAGIANKHNADVFVSIHVNAANNPAAHGLEAIYFRESGTGNRLAENILDKLVLETGLENRGTKEAGFAVLRKTNMTAVLIECGFLTNSTEEALLKSELFQKKCAAGIARGVMKFLNIEEEKTGMFKDVNPGDWYAQAIETVVKAGIMGGYPDGSFKPEAGLKRAEIASIFSRYLFRDGVFTDILPEVLPSVVRISHSKSIGSGVSIGGGIILTCRHVVEGVQTVTVDTAKGTVSGTVITVSAVPGEDLALIRVESDLPIISFASSVAIGAPVAVIGSPLGIRQAVTVGVVSALDQGGNQQFTQIDSPINPGNSGGPVINEKGELVGIATAKVVSVAVEGFGYITNLEKINAFLGRVK